jgi:hypothetical protein
MNLSNVELLETLCADNMFLILYCFMKSSILSLNPLKTIRKLVKEIEDAYLYKNKPTYHFPAYSTLNLININNMNQFSIIQGFINVSNSGNSLDNE